MREPLSFFIKSAFTASFDIPLNDFGVISIPSLEDMSFCFNIGPLSGSGAQNVYAVINASSVSDTLQGNGIPIVKNITATLSHNDTAREGLINGIKSVYSPNKLQTSLPQSSTELDQTKTVPHANPKER